MIVAPDSFTAMKTDVAQTHLKAIRLFPAKNPLGKPTGRPTGNPLESVWLLHGFLRLFDSFTPPKPKQTPNKKAQ